MKRGKAGPRVTGMEATGKGEKIPYNAVVQQKVDSFVGQKIICLLIKMWRGPALYIEETNEQLLLLLPESICNCVLPLMDKNA